MISERGRVRDLIRDFSNEAKKYSGNHVIVTARITDYAVAPLQRFDHFHLTSFTWRQIEFFAHNWLTIRNPSNLSIEQEKQNLLKALKAPRVHRLASNPLYLTILSVIYSNEGDLPSERIRLYDDIINSILMLDKRKGLTDEPKFDLRERKARLGCIAFYLQDQGKETARVEQIFQALMDQLKISYTEAEEFVNWATRRAGLLLRAGFKCGFRHSSFQGYFAAWEIYERYIDTVSPNIAYLQEILWNHLFNPSWKEVHLFLIGKLHPQPVTHIIQFISTRGASYDEPRKLLMLLRFLAEDIQIGQLRNGILEEICQLFLLRKQPVSMDDTTMTLFLENWSQYYREFLSILPEIRGSACEFEILNCFLEALTDDSPSIKIRAVDSLGQLGNTNDRTLSALINALTDEDPSVPDRVRFALIRLCQDDAKITERLFRIAEGEKNQNTPLLAHIARVLMHLHYADALTLSIAFSRAKKHIIKEWLQCTLEEKRSSGQIPPETMESLVPILVQALEFRPPIVRSLAAEIAGKLGCLSAQEALRERLQDGDENVKKAAQRALEKLSQ